MKKKNIMILIILIIIVLCFILYKTFVPFKIPENYNLKFENNKSYIDGPDKTFYIYNNKIIVEEKSYFPDGYTKGTKNRNITVYKNIDTKNIKVIDDVYNLIKNKEGIKVYDKYD